MQELGITTSGYEDMTETDNTNISPDAIGLSILWAKLFQSWLYNYKTRTIRDKNHPLLIANQVQIEYFLRHDWTPTMVKDALNIAKKENKKADHVYILLRGTQKDVTLSTSGTSSQDELDTNISSDNLLATESSPTHRVLFERSGVVKTSFTLTDLIERTKVIFPKSNMLSKALLTLVRAHGLDVLLYAIEVAEVDNIKLRSPWGLVLMLDKAKQKRDARVGMLKGLVLEANLIPE